MLRHFDKLKAPPRSVFVYPTLQAQTDRFTGFGWSQVSAETLWEAWSSDKYLSSEERRRLNDIEPFDEWEELAIFGAHYCVVIASAGPGVLREDAAKHGRPLSEVAGLSCLTVDAEFSEYGSRGQRRFGAPIALHDTVGQPFLANTLGQGNRNRMRSIDLHTYGKTPEEVEIPSAGPSSRMCHSTVDLGVAGNLLIGGRASPSSPLRDCWLFNKATRSWQKLNDLPIPLYRHAITRLGHTSLALLVGGKTGASVVFGGCLLYRPESGWHECEIAGQAPAPVFGATLVCFGPRTSNEDTSGSPNTHRFEGIVCGGLLQDGTIAKQTLRWELAIPESGTPVVRFFPLSVSLRGSSTAAASDHATSLLSRFGAGAVVDKRGFVLIVGGVIASRILSRKEEILLVRASSLGVDVVGASAVFSPSGSSVETPPRPLLIGMSTNAAADRTVVTMGGGATCFSMGSYWNKGCYTLRWGIGERLWGQPGRKWEYHQTLELTDGLTNRLSSSQDTRIQKPKVVEIPRVQLGPETRFADILKNGRPVVIGRCDLGPCVQAWTPDHLVAMVGQDRKVVVHEAGTPKLDFNAKNFNYVTKDFASFMGEVEKGGKMYLRALSEDEPANRPASLAQDFQGLADEFRIPEEMAFVAQNLHSSVLRITGPVNMWLHYDVSTYLELLGRLEQYADADGYMITGHGQYLLSNSRLQTHDTLPSKGCKPALLRTGSLEF
jgi:tRNA wybutosine-synthesizing protein 4